MVPFLRLALTGAAAGAAFVFGSCSGCTYSLHEADASRLAEYRPLPHHVPKNPAGLSFRFAMAHDVLVERYSKHGPAYWRERERLARARLATIDRDDRAAFPYLDDVAVGLHRTGRSDEAIALLRDKLAQQQRLKVVGRPLYTTYANLGTALTEANFAKAAAGDAKAKELFREGVGHTRYAIEINPQAHFGRETWQAAYGEFLLLAMDEPKLLNRFDFTGNHLGGPIPRVSEAHGAREYTPDYDYQGRYEVPGLFKDGAVPEEAARWAEFVEIRKYITKIGAESGWKSFSTKSVREPVAFDEPALGIVGMWRQGSGASPHLALALGETMLRVGQRYLAWNAFERAARLAEQAWPDPERQTSVLDYCRSRQRLIERDLTGSESTPEELRRQFDVELAHGEAYQREYQEYETAKIAAGASIDDEHFYDEFDAGRESIATAPGPEEWYVAVRWVKKYEEAFRRAPLWGLLAAGVTAMGIALLPRKKPRAKLACPEISS